MKKGYALEKKEMTSLLVNAITVKMLFSFPRSIVVKSGTAAWIQMIYMSLITLIIFFLTVKVYEKAGMNNIVNIADKIGGRWLKIGIGIALTVVLGLNMTVNMRFFPESVNAILLPETPMEFILLLFAICIAFGAYMGIESIARVNAMFLPIAGLFLIGFLVLLIPHIQITNMYPVLGTGTYNIFVRGWGELRVFADIIVLNILLPFCKNRKQAISSGYRAIIISGIIGTLISVMYVMIFPYPTSTEFLTPIYMMARLLRIGRYFQRLEAFFEFIWSIAMLIYASLYLFAICHVWKEMFNLRYIRPIIFPMVTLMVMLSLVPSSVVDLYQTNFITQWIIYPAAFTLPLVVGLLYRVKARRRKKLEKN